MVPLVPDRGSTAGGFCWSPLVTATEGLCAGPQWRGSRPFDRLTAEQVQKLRRVIAQRIVGLGGRLGGTCCAFRRFRFPSGRRRLVANGTVNNRKESCKGDRGREEGESEREPLREAASRGGVGKPEADKPLRTTVNACYCRAQQTTASRLFGRGKQTGSI